ncbi:MAG: YciI family protein [Proteobacteria bacterium]|nr:YciI family protein [Pseudomonadota bacterium]
MWYAIISEDVENSLDLRIRSRAAHLARLKTLADEGRVLIAGPHPASDRDDAGPEGFTGSLVVVDFPSLEEAQAWADVDPYTAAGVYAKVTVKPFKLVLP